MRLPVFLLGASVAVLIPPCAGTVRADVPASTPSPRRFDFGKQGVLDNPRVEHVFRFRNETGAPLRLVRLDTSCGCTSAVVSTEGSAAPAKPLPTLAPNQEASVRLAIDLTQLQPGQLLESVTLYAAGSSQPVARFEMAGLLVPTVSFSPAIVDFRRAEAGKQQAVVLTAYLDPRVIRSGVVPVPSATNPAVRVQLGGPVDPAAAGFRPVGTPDNARPYSYRVSLNADAPLGMLDGELEFVSGHPVAADRVDQALASVRLPVIGQVVGAVSAQPQVVVFGKSSHAEPSTREITLTAADAALLKKVDVTANSAWVRGQLVPGQGGDGRTRVLRLTLTPSADAPPTVVQLRVTLRFANGQRMLLPVTGYVPPSPPAARSGKSR